MEAVVKSFISNKMAWFGQGAPEPDFEASGRGPPGSGGKVEPVVKSSVIEWPGLDRVLRSPILRLPEGVLLDPEEKWSL